MKLLVDGNLLANRCRHSGARHLRTSYGEPTGVSYGCLRGVQYYCKCLGVMARNVTVVWDGGLSEKRLEMFPDYKISRRRARERQTEDEAAEYQQFLRQLDDVRAGLSYLGFRQVRVLGCEADDLISIIAHFCERLGLVCTIVSSDGDFGPIVTDMIRLCDPRDMRPVGQDDMLGVTGLTSTKHLLVWRAFVGDSSDDIPGVPNIGKVRASKILSYWGRPTAEIPKKDRKYIEEVLKHRDIVDRNLALMRLPKDWGESFYSTEQAIDAMSQYQDLPKPNPRAFAELAQRLEFAELLQTL